MLRNILFSTLHALRNNSRGFVVRCCCLLLFVVVCCCLLLFVVVCCCLLLFVVVCCCLLLFVVVCCYLLLFVVVWFEWRSSTTSCRSSDETVTWFCIVVVLNLSYHNYIYNIPRELHLFEHFKVFVSDLTFIVPLWK